MKNKLIAIAFALASLFSLTTVPAVYADSSICNQNVAEEVKAAAGCSNASAGTSLETVVQNIINVIVGLLGIVCVAVIIFGGVQYMTSTGDSGKTAKAKNTILYAVIGLIICALAAIITNFTINLIN